MTPVIFLSQVTSKPMSDWVQKGVNIIFILLFLLNTYIAIMDAMEDVPNMDYHVSADN